MGFTEDFRSSAQTWREEVNQLFGLRWDTLLEWVIVGWASLWLFTSWRLEESRILPTVGPIEWLSKTLDSLGIEPFPWLMSIHDWLVAPSREGILGWLVVISAIFATFAVRHRNSVGLRFAALLLIMLAFEVAQNATPLLGAVLVAAVPATIAFAWGLVHTAQAFGKNLNSYYYPASVVGNFVRIVIEIYGRPVLAPMLFAFLVVDSYRTRVPFEPEAEAVSLGLQELRKNPSTLANMDAHTALTTMAAVLSIQASPALSRDVAGVARAELKRKQRDRADAARFERERKQRQLRN